MSEGITPESGKLSKEEMNIGALSPEDQIKLALEITAEKYDTYSNNNISTLRKIFVAHLHEVKNPIPADVGLELAKTHPVEVAINLHKFEYFNTNELIYSIFNLYSKKIHISDEVVENLLKWAKDIDGLTASKMLDNGYDMIMRKYKKSFKPFYFDAVYHRHIPIHHNTPFNVQKLALNDDIIEFWLDNMIPEDLSNSYFTELFVSPNIIKKHPERFETLVSNEKITEDNRNFQQESTEKEKKFIAANPELETCVNKYIIGVGKESFVTDKNYADILITDAIKEIDNPDFILDMTPESLQDKKFHYTLNVFLLTNFLNKKDSRYDQALLRHAGRFTEADLRERLESVAQTQWKKTHDLSLLEHFPELISVLSKKDVEKAATNGHVRLLFKNWDKAKDAGYTKEQVVDGAIKHKRYVEVAQILGELDTVSPELYKTLWVELNKPENRAEAKSDPRLALAMFLEKGTGYGNDVAEGLLEIGKRGQLAENLNRFSGLSQGVADRLSKRDEKTGTSFEEDVARYYSSFA